MATTNTRTTNSPRHHPNAPTTANYTEQQPLWHAHAEGTSMSSAHSPINKQTTYDLTSILTTPPIQGRNTSGTVTDPSSF